MTRGVYIHERCLMAIVDTAGMLDGGSLCSRCYEHGQRAKLNLFDALKEQDERAPARNYSPYVKDWGLP